MADVSSFVSTATIAKYEKGYQDLTFRSRLFSSMLQRRGRVTYNNTGTEMKWQAMISLARGQGFAKGTTLEYGSTNPNIQFTAGWRGMYAAESMDIWDVAMNQSGDSQLIDLWQQKANIVMEGLKQDFWQEAFNSGSDSTLPEGLESFLTYTACASADRIARPNDTYAGLSTVLQSQGGSWSAASGIGTKPSAALTYDWPDGRGRPEYDATSPLLIHLLSTTFGGSTVQANIWRAIDQAKTWMMKNGDKEHQPDVCFLSSDYWTYYRNSQEAKTHLLLPHKEASDLGFPDTLNMDGLAIKGTDFDMPPATGYIINLKTVELCCMLNTLFKLIVGKSGGSTIDAFLKSAGFDLDTLSTAIVAIFMGNYKYRPKYVCKLADFSS
jgi:hypothetical protein